MSVDVADAKQNLFVDVNGRYNCPFCDVTMARKDDLKTHMNKHSARFRCEVCDLNLTRQTILDAHMTGVKHLKKISEKQFPQNMNEFVSPKNPAVPSNFSIQSLLDAPKQSSPEQGLPWYSVPPVTQQRPPATQHRPSVIQSQPDQSSTFSQPLTPMQSPFHQPMGFEQPRHQQQPAQNNHRLGFSSGSFLPQNLPNSRGPNAPHEKPRPLGLSLHPSPSFPPGPPSPLSLNRPGPPGPPCPPAAPGPPGPQNPPIENKKSYYEQNNPFRYAAKDKVKNTDILQDALNFAFSTESTAPSTPSPVQFSLSFDPKYLNNQGQPGQLLTNQRQPGQNFTNHSQPGQYTTNQQRPEMGKVRNAKFESYLAQHSTAPPTDKRKPRQVGAGPTEPPASPVSKSGPKSTKKKDKRKYEKYWCIVCRVWIGGGKALVSKHLRSKHDYEECEIVYITSTGMLKVDKEDFLPEGLGSKNSKESPSDDEMSPKKEKFVPLSKEVSFSPMSGVKHELEDSGIDLSVSF